ncbi:WD40 repeat domain-containing protein [Mesorhizobium sp.]|uniref:WD40 repeat domain-containing protein n=1 Tax=Mesorhizobium sp. TaxID=1871066 RepID=UPI000FE97AA4|nr:WD40 repeat domain-containing protein [Mesorhizobium sp.]RWP58618.1 MAG: hypothetical protein EOR08_26610 [Mesorhizobium sp.]
MTIDPNKRINGPVVAPRDGFLYDAFASYATDPDGQLVRTVEGLLESFHRRPDVPKHLVRELELCVDGRDFTFPRSTHDTDPSSAIEQVIRGYQRQCRSLVVFCGPGAREHPWINREIQWWDQERPGGPIYLAYTHGNYPNPRLKADFMPTSLIHRGGPDNSTYFDLRGYHGRRSASPFVRLRKTARVVAKTVAQYTEFFRRTVGFNRTQRGVGNVDEWIAVRSLDDEVCRIAAQLVSDKTGAALAPTDLTDAYLAAQFKAKRRRFIWTVFAVVLLSASIGAAWISWDRLERHRRLVDLANEAQAEIDDQRFENAMRLTLAGLPIHADVPWAPSWDDPDVQVLLAKLAGAANLSVFKTQISEGGNLTSATFSPDGRRILLASESGVASVWDTNSMTMIAQCDQRYVVPAAERTPGQHKASLKWIRDSQFSRDGRHIVSVGPYRTAWIWSPDDATCEHRVSLSGHLDDVRTGAFSPDGKLVVTTSDDDTVRIWDATTGRERQLLPIPGSSQPPDEYTTSAEFSPDGRSLAMTRSDGLVAIADTSDFRVVTLDKGPFAWRARFSPDGKKLVTALDNGAVFVWDLAQRTKVPLPKQFMPVVDASFSPDGRFIVTASADYTVRIWEVASLSERLVLKGHLRSVSRAEFSPDGKAILTSSADGTARVWDVSATVDHFSIKGHSRSIRSTAISSDGKYFVTLAKDHRTVLWAIADNAPSHLREIISTDGQITSIGFDPSKPRMALTYSDGVVSLVDIANSKEHDVVSISNPGNLSVSVSPNSNQIVIGSDEIGTESILFDLTMNARRPLQGAARISSVEIDPTGQHVAMGSYDHSVGIWEMTSGERTLRFEHAGEVLSVHFSPDGKSLVTASLDGTARIWDASTGHLLTQLIGHGRDVNAARFSPDGARVVTASGDHTVRVWDVRTGSPIVRFEMESTARDAVFTSDGSHIVASSDEGYIEVFDIGWTVDRSNLPRRVCNEKLKGIEVFPVVVDRMNTILRKLGGLNACARSFTHF